MAPGSNRLASAVPQALRRSLFLEALYLLTRVAGLESTLRVSHQSTCRLPTTALVVSPPPMTRTRSPPSPESPCFCLLHRQASLAESGGEEVSILSTEYGKHASQVRG